MERDTLFEAARLKGFIEGAKLGRLQIELEIANRLQRLLENKKYKEISGIKRTMDLAKFLGIAHDGIILNASRIISLKNEIAEQKKLMGDS